MERVGPILPKKQEWGKNKCELMDGQYPNQLKSGQKQNKNKTNKHTEKTLGLAIFS